MVVLFREGTYEILNCGIYLSLVIGVLLILRPVTNRLLTPGQRMFLWGVVWLAGFMPIWMELMGRIPLPISLRQLVTARTPIDGSSNLPWFIPEIREAGTYCLALPGGEAVAFPVSQRGAEILGGLVLIYWVLAFFLACRGDRGVERLTRNARELDPEGYEALGLRPEKKLRIKVCPALPTSFVVRHVGYHEIFLQQELPPEQMKLVLLHEREHAKRHHPWLQGLATVVWCFCFWSPLVWAGYLLFRRDMELACDRGVMDRLDEKGRRDYARTLVELASDKPVWGGLTSFGECDAALRVKKAVDWRPGARDLRWLLGWAAALLLALFLLGGAPNNRALRADVLQEMERMDIWEQAAEQLDWDADTTFYFKGSGSFASVKFQDGAGAWQQILYRREETPRYGIEIHCTRNAGAPQPGEYRVLLPGDQ